MTENKKPAKKKTTPSSNGRPTIGFLAGASNRFFHLMWCGIADVARESNVNALSFVGEYVNLPHQFRFQANILYDLVDVERLDGLVIWGLNCNLLDPDETREFYERFQPLPVVSVAQPMEGITNILADNYGGMHKAITHLIEVHGCRRIAYIKGLPNFREHDDRYRAYVDALAEYGLPFDPTRVVVPRDGIEVNLRKWGQIALRRLLDEQHADVDALVTNDDYFAHALLPELQARGIRVPGDMALVSFDDEEGSHCLTPPLTTVPYPMYEMGQRAAETLLAKMAGQQVPEQMAVPARLIVRQSCGCLDPKVTQAVAGPVARTKTAEPFEDILAAQRGKIIAEIVRAAEISGAALNPGLVEQLLDAFVATLTVELTEDEPVSFLSTLDDILRQVISADGDIEVWPQVLSTLRRHLLPYLTIDEAGTLYRAEDLWLQAQVMIGEVGQRAQAYRNLQAEQRKFILDEIALTTIFDLNDLVDILARELPRLGISRGYLSLYEDPQPYRYPQPAPRWSRLVLAYDQENPAGSSRIELEASGQRFPSRQLVPPDILPQQGAYTLVVEALYFQDEQIGFMVLDGGQRDGDVYGTLRAQISNALQGALLVQQVQEHSAEIVRRNAEIARNNAEIARNNAEIARNNAEIARQKYVLDMFIETVPDRIWFKDREGRFTRTNRAHAAALGFHDPSEEGGKTAFDIFGEKGGRLRNEEDLQILRTGQPLLNKEFFETWPDGTERWSLTTKMPLRDEHGQIIGTFGISRDITALKQTQAALERAYAEVEHRVEERTAELQREIAQRIRAEEEIRTLNSELEDRVKERTATLEALNKELQNFAYVVSHDLKAPLRGIAHLAHWLVEDYGAAFDEQGREMAALLVSRVKRLDDLIEGILQYSRIGRTDTEDGPVDLNRVVLAVIDSLSVPEHIQINIDSALPIVHCNMIRMTQVFQNLIGNAVKFLDKPQGTITISYEDHGNTWLFRVTDNGPGIEERHYHRIFKIFQILTARDQLESTGIGLTLVKKIVESYGGEVWVESTVGEGSTFAFTLPKGS